MDPTHQWGYVPIPAAAGWFSYFINPPPRPTSPPPAIGLAIDPVVDRAVDPANDPTINNMALHEAPKEEDKTSLLVALAPSFLKFMQLPKELRERIYGFALACAANISPQLCDKRLRFHDASQTAHNAITKMLGITRVSKLIRSESLPMFYAVNTFWLSNDLTSYFDRLECLGRFHMIRNVQFDIYMRPAHSVAIILRSMDQFLRETANYENSLVPQNQLGQILDKASKSIAHWVGYERGYMANHPQYLYGGLTDLNLLIALRKLTSAVTNIEGECTQRIVLPMPCVSTFVERSSLRWFRDAMQGLGIHLQLAENQSIERFGPPAIRLTWRQKFQKKDFIEAPSVTSISADEVKQRALHMYPELETMKRPVANCFMRPSCDGVRYTWYDVYTEGGGVFVDGSWI